MKAAQMTDAMFRAASLKCPIPLPGGKGAVKVPAESGNWFAWTAKSEVLKRYRKVAINDLRTRQLRGGSYDGDVGHVVIGGKRFSLYPHSGMLVRDDFAQWCEANFLEFWDPQNHRERLPPEPKGRTVEVRETLKIWKDIRKRALEMDPPTGLMHESAYNSLWDMKHGLADYDAEIKADRKRGASYASTKIIADQLAATIAYRQKMYADAIDFYLDCAAACLRAALFVQQKHGGENECA